MPSRTAPVARLAGGREQTGFLAVVGGVRDLDDRLAMGQARCALLVVFELDRPGRGEQVGAEEFAPDQPGDQRRGGGGGVVLGDVPPVVVPHKRKLALPAEFDGADKHVAQRRVGPARLAQGQLDKAAVLQAGAQLGEEIGGGTGVHAGRRTGPTGQP